MILEALQYTFFQNALIATFLVSIAGGIIGTYIVVKRMSLISGSIAHTVFGGLGLSYYLGINPLIGATFFSLIAATSIALIRKYARNRMDALLSALWSVGMAIGLIFIFITTGYTTDLFTFLFGNILLVNSFDLILIFALDVIVITATFIFFNVFKAVIFDEEAAEVRNIPVTKPYIILFSLISLTIVMVIKVVGIILMIALLTMPAATAQLFNKTVKSIMFWAFILTLVVTVGGLFASLILNFPTGPIIILFAAAMYIIGMLISYVRIQR